MPPMTMLAMAPSVMCSGVDDDDEGIAVGSVVVRDEVVNVGSSVGVAFQTAASPPSSHPFFGAVTVAPPSSSPPQPPQSSHSHSPPSFPSRVPLLFKPPLRNIKTCTGLPSSHRT